MGHVTHMTHSPTTWLFITLRPGLHIVMDVDLGSNPDTDAVVLAESPMFDDSGISAEIGDMQ